MSISSFYNSVDTLVLACATELWFSCLLAILKEIWSQNKKKKGGKKELFIFLKSHNFCGSRCHISLTTTTKKTQQGKRVDLLIWSSYGTFVISGNTCDEKTVIFNLSSSVWVLLQCLKIGLDILAYSLWLNQKNFPLTTAFSKNWRLVGGKVTNWVQMWYQNKILV